MDHAQRAQALFLEGYNCAQATFGAFCDVTGLEFETAIRLASGLGGGMGRMRGVCGACAAAGMGGGRLRACTTMDRFWAPKIARATARFCAGSCSKTRTARPRPARARRSITPTGPAPGMCTARRSWWTPFLKKRAGTPLMQFDEAC